MSETKGPHKSSDSMDFSTYTQEELEYASASIDSAQYPENYQALVQEIQRRELRGEWHPAPAPEVSVEDRSLDVFSFGGRQRVEIRASPILAYVLLVGFFSSIPVIIFWWAQFENIFFSLFVRPGGFQQKLAALFIAGSFLWGVCQCIWSLAGREVVELDTKSLTLTFKVAGFALQRKTALFTEIKGVRVVVLRDRRSKSLSYLRVFEIVVRDEVWHFGKGIDQEQVRRLLDVLRTAGVTVHPA